LPVTPTTRRGVPARAAMVELAARNVEAVLEGHPAPTPLPGTPSLPGRRAPRAGQNASLTSAQP
jgi:hypothetical protein